MISAVEFGLSGKTIKLTALVVFFSWFVVPRFFPFAGGAALVLGQVWLLAVLVKASKAGTRLWVLMGTAYGIRLAAALVFYLVSLWRLPVLAGHQASPGFWCFAPDTEAYHLYAQQMLAIWRSQHALPQVFAVHGQMFDFGPEYFLTVMGIYGWFGVHPLYVIFWNVWFSALQVLVVFWMLRALLAERQALIACWWVACWPSSVIWSTQLLKDSLCGLLVMIIAASAILSSRHGNTRMWQRTAGWVVVFFSSLVITRLRYYVGICGMIAAAVQSVAIVLASLFQRRWVVRPSLLITLAVIIVGTLASTMTPDLRTLFSAKQSTVPTESIPKSEAIIPLLPKDEAPLSGKAMDKVTLSGKVADSFQHAAGRTPPSASTAPAPRIPPLDSVVSVDPANRPHSFAEGVSSGWKQLRQRLSFSNIHSMRTGFIGTGGTSLVRSGISTSSFFSLVSSLPRAVLFSLFAPFPSQWLFHEGGTGMFRAFASVEMALIYGLSFSLLVGSLRALRSGGWAVGFVLLFVGLMAVGMGIVVANIGTLFRLRASYLIPWLAVGVGYFAAATKPQAKP